MEEKEECGLDVTHAKYLRFICWFESTQLVLIWTHGVFFLIDSPSILFLFFLTKYNYSIIEANN